MKFVDRFKLFSKSSTFSRNIHSRSRYLIYLNISCVCNSSSNMKIKKKIFLAKLSENLRDSQRWKKLKFDWIVKLECFTWTLLHPLFSCIANMNNFFLIKWESYAIAWEFSSLFIVVSSFSPVRRCLESRELCEKFNAFSMPLRSTISHITWKSWNICCAEVFGVYSFSIRAGAWCWMHSTTKNGTWNESANVFRIHDYSLWDENKIIQILDEENLIICITTS